ncbi:MAG TPA: carbamoyltransferase HypF [Lentisphaeria bacterium]|nr:MAG: carbamoyltransferase HypF [Lentisphaerae bacterium GWF2_38_69]HBM14859.1 carbamoyltransferase HypF [Lentisphaeria bacterium]
MIRKTYEICGIVQGVGFRPAIHNFAIEKGLGGSIQNSSGRVKLSLIGSEEAIDSFLSELSKNLPAQARIDSINLLSTEICDELASFEILESSSDENYKITIPADLAICEECRREIFDPANKRYRYPFTTCVNCGPRYTVVNSMPYDRCRTTLSSFPLCGDCLKEYTNPSDRRFHAESIACPKCGPTLTLHDSEGKRIEVQDCLHEFQKYIKSGKIVAVKGIGGFLIALDAENKDAVKLLRERKKRPHKPFALMARNIEVIKKYCIVTEPEEKLLSSSSAPIVILRLKKCDFPLISPDSDTIGFMLPYSPLHELLFDDEIDLMVMTSGNKKGEPVCISNEEAFIRLKGIVDAFLCHDREINLRNDDSLSVIQLGKEQIWRRARGYAPNTLYLKHKTSKNILALGAELKNTITLAYDNEAVISPHIGDLETVEANDTLTRLAKVFPQFYRKDIQLIVKDLHPDMHSSQLAMRIATEKKLPFIEVQHHHAHALSCMAEHSLDEALAVVFDGTGLGTDGKIWGAELLYVEKDKFERLATFKEVRLPGGDKAVYYPVRQLVGRYLDAGIDPDDKFCRAFDVSPEELKIWTMQSSKGINSPYVHAAGRLFDAVSVLLGITRGAITYEGQGAIRLEREALKYTVNGRAVSPKRPIINETIVSGRLGDASLPVFMYKKILKDNLLYIDWSEIFRKFTPEKLIEFYRSDNYLEIRKKYAYEFHNAVSKAALEMVLHAVSIKGKRTIVLSGGVFMNRLFTELLFNKLTAYGLKVYINEKVPPNDGGISFGQAVMASYQTDKQYGRNNTDSFGRFLRKRHCIVDDCGESSLKCRNTFSR